MVQVHIVGIDGDDAILELPEGMSLMEAAVRAGVVGIDADCGGQLACATCHVIVAPEWFDLLPAVAPDEQDMLQFSAVQTATSRLSCQILLSDALGGLSVTIPARQS